MERGNLFLISLRMKWNIRKKNNKKTKGKEKKGKKKRRVGILLLLLFILTLRLKRSGLTSFCQLLRGREGSGTLARVRVFRQGAVLAGNTTLVKNSFLERFLHGFAFSLFFGLGQLGFVSIRIHSQRFQLIPRQPLPIYKNK